MAIARKNAQRRRREWIDSELRRVASKQHGLVDLSSVKALGIGQTSMDRRVREGLFIEVHRGVYRFATFEPNDRQRIAAARLAAGSQAIAIGRAAAVLHKLPIKVGLDVCVLPKRRIEIPGVRVFRRSIRLDEQTTVAGILTTTIGRTFVDLATLVSFDELERAVDDAFARQVITIDELWSATKRHTGKEGAPRLRSIIGMRADGNAKYRSEKEQSAFEFLDQAGLLDGCIPNYRIIDADGIERFLDFAWPALGIALELDTFRWHTGKRSWGKDRHRANAVVAVGWTLLVATDSDLDEQMRQPIQKLRQLMVAAA
jgi:very-short-patch-repair endonuclease